MISEHSFIFLPKIIRPCFIESKVFVLGKLVLHAVMQKSLRKLAKEVEPESTNRRPSKQSETSLETLAMWTC